MIKQNYLITSHFLAEAPSFVKLLEDKTIQEYEEVQLSVRVNGIPKPKVTW